MKAAEHTALYIKCKFRRRHYRRNTELRLCAVGAFSDKCHGKIIRRSGVGYEAMRDTVLNPERINPVKTDSRGKRSVRLIGKAIVTINPDTGQLIQLNPRSEQK